MINVEELKEFETLSKPLIKWLNDNGNPHTKIEITCTSAEVYGGLVIINTEEFIKD
jgi:hypothetical protein